MVNVPVPPFAQPTGKAYPDQSRQNRKKTLSNLEVLISLALVPALLFRDGSCLW